MAWTYDIQGQKLSNGSGTWDAVSGPYGNGALEAGRYTIESCTALENGDGVNTSYKDKAGNAWWCSLRPLFSTSRTSIGIHPDGGVPGTEGCIGITGPGNDTTSALRALRSSTGETLTVR